MSSTISSSKTAFSFSDLPLSCKLLLMFSFIESIGGSIAYHIAYFFSVSSDFNKLDIGILGFVMGIGALLGSLYGGYVSGKIPAKKLIGTSFLLMGFAFVCLAKINSFPLTVVLVALTGFGINLFLTCNNSTLLLLSKENHYSLTMAQSFKNAMENAGGIVAMVLIMFLAQHYFKSTLFSIGLAFVFVGVYTWLRFDIKSECVEPGLLKKEKTVETVYGRLLPLLFSVFCIGLTYGIQKTVLGVHLNETINNSFIIGFFFATDSILITLFQVKLSRRMERFNPHIIACLGCLLLGASTFALALSATGMQMFCSLGFFTLGEMLFMPNSVTLCHRYGGSNHSGLGVGAWRSAYALGMMFGPLISGIAMHYFSAQSAWTMSSLLCLFSAYLVLSAAKKNG